MKVAICISGEPRFFKEGYISLKKNILDHNDCDIFLQTYEGPDTEEIINTYKPVNTVIDKRIKDFHITFFSKFNRAPETNVENMFWMFRNIKKSIELVGSDYDLIIRTRSDLIYQKPLILSRLDAKIVHIPSGGDWRKGIFDMFAISNVDNMRHYANVFDKLNSYIRLGVKAHPETLLKYHLLHGGHNFLKIIRFDFNIELMRLTNGVIVTHLANKIQV